MLHVFCVNNGVTRDFPVGVSLLDVYNELGLEMPYGVIAARVNNEIVGLAKRLYRHKDVEFIDVTTDDGIRMYVRSLTFIFMKAMNEMFPGEVVRFENAISRGYYCRASQALTDEQVARLRDRMRQIVESDIPFKRIDCHTQDAIEVFRKVGRMDKVRLLETYGYLYTSYYELDGYVDSYYNGLVPSTGYIRLFEIEKYADGVLLRVPSKERPTRLEDKVPQEKLQELFEERLQWHQKMGVETIGDFNLGVRSGHGIDLVNVSEVLQERRLSSIADEILEHGARVVLIAGPSSSGKTTFSKRLSVQLLACGLKPYAISLDDYFVNRTLTPRKPDGDYDFESLYSIDLPYFNESLTKILAGEEEWIFPYQENADVMFNTSLFYEISVIRPFVEPILREVPNTAPEYAEAVRMLKFLDNFTVIKPDEIPPTSILREFIGGSSFKY